MVNSTNFFFSPTNSELYHNLKINIDLDSFPIGSFDSSLGTIRDNWLINLSSTIIPQDVQCLLQLGNSFLLPIHNKRKIIFELIKSLECNTMKFDIDTQLNLRNRVIQ